MKTNPHFVCGAGQPGPHFAGLSGAGLCGTGWPALPPLKSHNADHINLNKSLFKIKLDYNLYHKLLKSV